MNEDAAYHDLTQSQTMFWMGQQLSPTSPMYNMALAFDLKGAIDPATFQKAFDSLIKKCDAMRLVFIEKDGIPYQQVVSDFQYKMKYLNFSEMENKTDHFNQWKRQRSQQTFDIATCLFDSVLIKMAADHFVWYFNQHHLITDAWATTLQFKLMASLYQQASGEDIFVPLFSDYVAYGAKLCEGKTYQKAVDHWTAKAASLPEPPAFYGQTNRTLKSHSERVSISLGKEKSDQLRALTTEADLRSWTQHLSLFTIFSTLLYSYIYRITGQQKLAIGTPAHNRITPDFKATPGVFIELFPLMTQIESEETFSSLIQKVRNEANEFLRYAQPNTSTSELNRGFNVVLNYINTTYSDFNEIPIQSEWIHSDHADPGHHLRLQVHDFNATGSIELCFDMNTAIFNEAQRAATPGYFLQLLDGFIEDRFQKINQPALVSSSRIEDNPTDFHFNEQINVVDLFEMAAAKNPEVPALHYDDASLSYAELEKHVNQLANYLRGNGLKVGDRVGVLLKRSPEFVISVLATLKVGATFIPIPINYPSGRILGIIEDAQAKIILSNSVLAARLPKSFGQLIELDKEATFIQQLGSIAHASPINSESLAYIMYTSGSTGKPKGVMIGHDSLAHYIQWAVFQYQIESTRRVMPLFTSLGFDLTITSLFLPLTTGGTLVTYQEADEGPDMALLSVMEDNLVNLIKLTPAHIAMLQGRNFGASKIETMIVGGENFKTDLAEFVHNNFNNKVSIYNEYGPTEATVGCVVHLYNAAEDSTETSVPIGRPISNSPVYILDELLNPVPAGVVGELFISGAGLAKGYWNQKELTNEKFIENPFEAGRLMYRSGDLVRVHDAGFLEYLGRKDLQVKIRGRRVELAEIESVLNQHPDIIQGVVELRERRRTIAIDEVHNCSKCGLPSNYPNSSFDEQGVCNLCQDFTSYQAKVQKYFKTKTDLKNLFDSVPANEKGDYDCLALLSGGKDSTYVLAQLVEMGLRPLAFTLDNGYISEEAKANIRRVVGDLKVDHVFGETEAMDAIFVDSLQRHCNVCDGCFKTIYTLSTQLALEKKIPFIVTGLSRGQFFETRLTEELFRQEDVDIAKIDETILNARKAYHQVDDAVKKLLDTSMFEDESVFEKIQFVDYYRYTDVSLAEMLDYLDKRLSWVRPSDTGRSTNCLINQAGIYVHKKERGYSNYAFPYSWDVRIGHKTREASLDEINEEIDEQEVDKILNAIGYNSAKAAATGKEQLVAYYVGPKEMEEVELRRYLLKQFPDYMVPVQFIRLEEMPLTVNGKIDRNALPEPDRIRPVLEVEYVEAQTEFEEMIRDIWSEVMQIDRIGVHDNFLDIGGDSLSGIRVMSRINEAMELDLPVNVIFQETTIAQLAVYIENTIKELLAELEKSGS